jgi:hypothetical protein
MSALVSAPLSRTEIARIWREVTGGTQMDQSAEEFARRIERAAVEASAAPELLESAKELAAHVREMCRCLSIPEPAASLERYEAAMAKAGGAA